MNKREKVMHVNNMWFFLKLVKMVITGKNATARVDTAFTRMIVSTRMEPALMDVN